MERRSSVLVAEKDHVIFLDPIELMAASMEIMARPSGAEMLGLAFS